MTITPALRAVMAHGRALGRLCAILSWSLWCVARRSPDSPGWSSWWAAGVCRRLGVQVEIRGPLPERATLVVANHLGYVDILALLSHCPVTFVAKCEIARWPVVGRLAAQAGLIFINRQRLRDVHRVKSAMEEALAAGHTVAYFPEGTSSNGRSVLPFRTGLFEVAFAAGVPVVTAAISGWAADAPPDDRVCWHGDADLLTHLYRLAATRHHGVIIRFGQLDRRCPERRALAAMARQTIIATRPVPAPAPCYYPRLPWIKGGLRWSR